jgi:hypothetical protein
MKTSEPPVSNPKSTEVSANQSNTRERLKPTKGASASPENLQQKIAETLETSTGMVVDQFMRDSSAKIERIDDRADELRIVLRIGFETPNATPDDFLQSEREVRIFRRRFCTFLKTSQVRRRLANRFYNQFVEFIFEHRKMYRLPQQVRSRIKPFGERRLAGRSPLLIPSNQVPHVKKQLSDIRLFVQDMRKTVTNWKKRNAKITDETVRSRLRAHYDRQKFPWVICLRLLPTILPAKRSHSMSSVISCPDQWSIDDFAVLWTQQWLFWTTGKRYDLKQIKRLITPA